MMKPTLNFNPDGRFRILMVSDAHHAAETGNTTIESMEKLLDATRPDFVFLNGDLIAGTDDSSTCKALIHQIVQPMESRGILWSHVFGNHDNTPHLSKEYQQLIYESYGHCLSAKGPDDIPGVGNYLLPIYYNGKPAFGIWALDSQQDFNTQTDKHTYKGDFYWDLLLPSRIASLSDSDYIRFEQVMWYYNKSKEMEKDLGKKLPSLMLFHIPIYEFNAIIRNPERTRMKGEYNEKVSASEINSGLFAAVLERGDVLGLFCGHDHINTFDGVYCNVAMGYDGSIGYHGYGARSNDPHNDRERLRGGRIFDIDAGDTSKFTTQMVFVNQL